MARVPETLRVFLGPDSGWILNFSFYLFNTMLLLKIPLSFSHTVQLHNLLHEHSLICRCLKGKYLEASIQVTHHRTPGSWLLNTWIVRGFFSFFFPLSPSHLPSFPPAHLIFLLLLLPHSFFLPPPSHPPHLFSPDLVDYLNCYCLPWPSAVALSLASGWLVLSWELANALRGKGREPVSFQWTSLSHWRWPCGS